MVRRRIERNLILQLAQTAAHLAVLHRAVRGRLGQRDHDVCARNATAQQRAIAVDELLFHIERGQAQAARKQGRIRPGPLLRVSRERACDTPRVASRTLFDDAAASVARRLIGAHLYVDGVGGRIVETEAYDRDDPASHSNKGPTARNASMFGPPGHAYVYRSYGIHWCLNLVCREAGHGAGVLLRAIEPLAGIERMRERRGLIDMRLLCAGPGRLGQALAITRALDGLTVDAPPFELHMRRRPVEVIDGPRIGISKAREQRWRFGLAGSAYLSRPFSRRFE